jgi:hypothetical protein
VPVFWCWLIMSAISLCIAASLGEIASRYPTSGGGEPNLSPRPWKRAYRINLAGVRSILLVIHAVSAEICCPGQLRCRLAKLMW